MTDFEKMMEDWNNEPKKAKETVNTKPDSIELDNPPLHCEEIPDSVLTEDFFKKLVELRKNIVETKNYLREQCLTRLVKRLESDSVSPYAQMQAIIAISEIQDALKSINTVIMTNATGEESLKHTIDEEAKKQGISPMWLVRLSIMQNVMRD